MIFFRWLMLPQLRRARSGHKMVVTNGKLTVNLDSTKGHQDLSWLPLVNIMRRRSSNSNSKCNICDIFSHFLKFLGARQYNQYGAFQTLLFYLVSMHQSTTFELTSTNCLQHHEIFESSSNIIDLSGDGWMRNLSGSGWLDGVNVNYHWWIYQVWVVRWCWFWLILVNLSGGGWQNSP